MPSLKYYVLGATVGAFVLMGLWLYWQHSTIVSQRDTIALQATQIDNLEKQKKAREKVAITHKKDIAKAQKERDSYKKKLEEAMKDEECTNAPLNDESSRVLKELYNSQSSF